MFTQASIAGTFADGGSVDDLIADIKAGNFDISELPPIRVVIFEGEYYSLDNRRLYVLKESMKSKRAQQVQVKIVKMDDLMDGHPRKTYGDDFFKKATTNQPNSIRIRDGLARWIPRKGPRGGLYIFDKDEKKVYVSQLTDAQIRLITQKDPGVGKFLRQIRSKEN